MRLYRALCQYFEARAENLRYDTLDAEFEAVDWNSDREE